MPAAPETGKLKLWHKIILALILGSIAGLILGEKSSYLAPVGRMFINAISMLVIPIIFTSIVCSVMAISDVNTMGRLTAKSLSFYIVTMAIATAIGIGFALLIKPGMGLPKGLVEASLKSNQAVIHIIAQNQDVSIVDTIISIIPANPFNAFANGEILPTILFAFVIGLAIVTTGKSAKPVGDFCQAGMNIMFKAVQYVLYFTPIGVFALIAQVVGAMGVVVLKQLSLLVATIYIGCIVHMIVVYSAILLYNGLNPLTFFKKMLNPMTFAFSTGSSMATLPINLETAQKRLGVSTGISDFMLPLGATINMHGLSVYLGVAALFVANIFGVELTLWQYLLIIMTSTMASIASAGVPMAGIIVMSIVLSAVGLPIEAIALIAGVDRIIEMMTTVLNVTGDTVAAVAIGKSEDQFDASVYNTNDTSEKKNCSAELGQLKAQNEKPEPNHPTHEQKKQA